jgi:hypothetical protein
MKAVDKSLNTGAATKVLDPCDVVDSPGDHALDCRPGAQHHPHSGAHDRDHQQDNQSEPPALAEFGFRARRQHPGEMEIPEEKIRRSAKIAKEPISMETPIGDATTVRTWARLSSKTAPTPRR